MIPEQSQTDGQEPSASEVPETEAASAQERAAEFRMPDAGPGFGARLRAAREAHGYSLESCGHALRLPVRVLRQLESGDYLGSDYQIYLGNYMRKYATHIGVDVAEVDAELSRIKPAQPTLVATGGVSHSRYLLDRYATAATYVVLTLVIAVPIVWMGMRGGLSRDMSHLAPLDDKPVAQQDAPATASTAAPAQTAVADAALAKASSAAPAAAPATHASEQPLLASMVPVPNLDNDVSITPSAPANTDASTVGAGDHSLSLNLATSSWVEVIGKDGSRLEYGLLPAGTTKTYKSNAPLDVRIGNATGAQVSIDGQPVQLDPYRHANVAHFHVSIQDGKAAPSGG